MIVCQESINAVGGECISALHMNLFIWGLIGAGVILGYMIKNYKEGEK